MILKDARQLDWSAAREASEAISRICADAWFMAPEDLSLHRAKIVDVASHMNAIAKALLITSAGDAS